MKLVSESPFLESMCQAHDNDVTKAVEMLTTISTKCEITDSVTGLFLNWVSASRHFFNWPSVSGTFEEINQP